MSLGEFNLKLPSSSSSGSASAAANARANPFFSSLFPTISSNPELMESADQMWKMLDEMAEKNPDEYEKFIKNTLKEAKEEKQKEKEKENKQNASAASASSASASVASAESASASDSDSDLVVPEAGFVIMSKFSSNSQSHSHSHSQSQSQSSLQPPASVLYINLCSHSSIPQMQDSHGSLATSSTPLNDLRIPLSVGRLLSDIDRDGASVCRTVDVVFHPSVLLRCLADMGFQLFLIELAIQNIENDHQLKIHRGYKFIKEIKYKGRNALPHRIGSEPNASNGANGTNQTNQINGNQKQIAAEKAKMKAQLNEWLTAASNPSSQSIVLPGAGIGTGNENETENGKGIVMTKEKPMKRPMIQEIDPTTGISMDTREKPESESFNSPSVSAQTGVKPVPSEKQSELKRKNEKIASDKDESKTQAILKAFELEKKKSATSNPAQSATLDSKAMKQKENQSEKQNEKEKELDALGIGQPVIVRRREKALPSYSFTTVTKAGNAGSDGSSEECLVLSVELPLESSATEVNADLASRSFSLNSPHYSMEIELPVAVNDQKSEAKFVKKTKTLKITAPVL